ncbi:MAG TPA: GNAT family N-acetyltransferase [Chitinophagaceae bacterium]|nr:GNAT family N-acetyltransferase [Chitinophagaceae bacterium]
MIKLVRTDSDNKNFIQLVKQLDAELAILDGEEHAFYAQLNKTDKIKHVIVAYENENPISCGAIREYSPAIMEVKRMYTIPESRGKGIATKVLNELEKWAFELAYQKCVLETGKRQPDAIWLYQKNGYKSIPNYGKYVEMENSVCFEKDITG